MDKRPEKVYQRLAACLAAWKNCYESVPINHEWGPIWDARITRLVDGMPHGSGIDGVWCFDRDNSDDGEFIFTCSYHNMDEHGGYDGWTDFKVRVNPSFQFGFLMRVVGPFPKKYSGTRDYIYDMVQYYLNSEVTE